MKYCRVVLLAPSANHLLVPRNEKLVWKFLDELDKDFLSHFHNVVQERAIISISPNKGHTKILCSSFWWKELYLIFQKKYDIIYIQSSKELKNLTI